MNINIMQPAMAEKIRDTAKALGGGGRRRCAKATSTKLSVSNIKERIKKIRQEAVRDCLKLSREFTRDLSANYPDVKVYHANNNIDAVNYISNISDGINHISTNYSSVVNQELAPGLRQMGFNIVNSYYGEFQVDSIKIRDYWDLPRMDVRNIIGTYDIAEKSKNMFKEAQECTKKYIAIIGVNAASVQNTEIFFLQHFSNISRDLREAQKVIIVIGIDKILSKMEHAEFQCKAMAIFGQENILLGIRPHNNTCKEVEINNDLSREVHMIILDNGRSEINGSKYKDINMCIGCRACNKHCPIRHSFTKPDIIWTPRNYLMEYLSGKINSVDTCLHCEACRLECPVDIDLPALMWEAKIDNLSIHKVSFYHRILGKPEFIAKIGSIFAPIANAFMKIEACRIIMELVTGIDRKAHLPKFHHVTFKKWFKDE